MAIKELFNDARPQVLFDPRASQRIDPRFKFTRDGVASYYDSQGVLRYVPANQPRVGFNYEPDENGVMLPASGLLLEGASTNYIDESVNLTDAGTWDNYKFLTPTLNAGTAPDGTNTATSLVPNTENISRTLTCTNIATAFQGTLTVSVFAKANGYNKFRLFIDGASAGGAFGGGADFDLNTGTVAQGAAGVGTITKLPNGWYRCAVTHTNTAQAFNVTPIIVGQDNSGNTVWAGDGTSGYLLWGFQLEASLSPTSYIPTAGSTVTREPDLLTIEAPLPATGSIYIDARSLGSDVDTTLLSAAPASPSTDKLALAIRQPASLYNSKALVYEVDGQFKPTLPFPVPSNAQERNLITYGANNYHYRSDSARYTPSSSDDVPANMTRLGIGHDVVDPEPVGGPSTVMTAYINAVYLWPGEITPTVAEALVRGDVDPKDADAGVFTPAAGSLAFVFNTQGTATDGNTVVQLPLRGSTNNVLVDWGDNTSSSLIGAAASVTVNHTYSSAGIYPVQIKADDDGTNSGLENLQFYANSPADLVRVLQWGGTTTFSPTTMYRIFRDCTQMDFENGARTNLPDTSGCSDWREAFYNCSSLSGQYPNFDHSGATQLTNAWYGCSSITSFSSSLNDLNTGSSYVLDYTYAWRSCTGIANFPAITIPSDQGAVSLRGAWEGCTGLTSFPNSVNTSAVTNFQEAWYNCSGITAFSTINTAAGTNFYRTWANCSGLTSFTLSNFSSATTLGNAFSGWAAFTGTFSAITTSASLTSLEAAWAGNKMTGFTVPSNTSQVTSFKEAWNNCTGLTGTFASIFSALDTSSAINFRSTWAGCTGLTGAFPVLDMSAGTDFIATWENTAITSFPAVSFVDGAAFARAWNNCSSMTTFAAGVFDSWTATPSNQCFFQTWEGCTSLTPASVVNILNSIAASGQSAPSGTGTHDKKITIDWDGTGDPATDAAAAITTLKSRNWQIYLNDVLQ